MARHFITPSSSSPWLTATISSSEWSTVSVPLRIGVYQGDPLSVAIFLTVMNTLSDTLCSRKDLGFPLPSSNAPVNHLLYADDACIVSSTPAGCQHLLDMVQRWLEWAKLKAKVPKCRSLVIQASTGRRITPNLSIGGQTIPPVEDDTFKFLGMPVRVYKKQGCPFRVTFNGCLRRSTLLPSLASRSYASSGTESAPDCRGH